MVADEHDHSQAYDRIAAGDSHELLHAHLVQLAQSSGYLDDARPAGRVPEVGNFGTCGMVNTEEWTEVPSNVERCLDDLARAITDAMAKSSSTE